ncbi:hypothetical protein Taro_036354 [Colocasia esculenta]|uniref:Gamma-tubulin complex component n=1 Tax=Colocasia esculenta TaxID=4460 RepID=A0A843WHL8_COLES|nr:hypothetical protein [Colocasia esculenta]
MLPFIEHYWLSFSMRQGYLPCPQLSPGLPKSPRRKRRHAASFHSSLPARRRPRQQGGDGGCGWRRRRRTRAATAAHQGGSGRPSAAGASSGKGCGGGHPRQGRRRQQQGPAATAAGASSGGAPSFPASSSPSRRGRARQRLGTEKREDSQCFVNKLYCSISRGIPFAEPVSSLRIDESDVVHGVLQMLQGFSSPLFTWDENSRSFVVAHGKFVSHLSQSSFRCILNQFVHAATCLKLVELFIKEVETLKNGFPTLKAFSNSVLLPSLICHLLFPYLVSVPGACGHNRVRNIALNEEVKTSPSDSKVTATLVGLTNPLSSNFFVSLCSGAEHLMQVVYGAVPSNLFLAELSIPAAEIAVLILDHLYKRLNEISLVQGGEVEEAYHMLLVIFVGSLLPYLRGLYYWLYDGTLDDPYDEMFFYANTAVTIDQAAFWDKSYLLRSWTFRSNSDAPSSDDDHYTVQVLGGRGNVESILRGNHTDLDVVCPVFLKDVARAILSAGKSLKLVQYVHDQLDAISGRDSNCRKNDFKMRESLSSWVLISSSMDHVGGEPECAFSLDSESESVIKDHFSNDSAVKRFSGQGMGVLTLSEIFLVSLVGLLGGSNHISEDLGILYQSFPEISKACRLYIEKQMLEKDTGSALPLSSEKFWYKFFTDTIVQKNCKLYNQKEFYDHCMTKNVRNSSALEKVNGSVILCRQEINHLCLTDEATFSQSFCPENPVTSVCTKFLDERSDFRDELNISRNFHLPSLNDELLREAIFGGCFTGDSVNSSQQSEGMHPRFRGTDYMCGFRFSELDCHCLIEDVMALESLYPFPTILPCVTEDIPLSDLLPFQDDSTLASRILDWIQGANLKTKPLPAVIIQNCLHVYINKQVDWVGNHILLKLMNDWKLMEELRVLRAIYLLGSGDILQQFLLVIFCKLDKAGSWDDDFELNTILQESIRNSADGAILGTPDSLTVSIIKSRAPDNVEYATNPGSTPRKIQNQRIGVNDLDAMEFTYKVSWPLDLIINVEAIKKYNQVMRFLLKIKHAKFVLDKTRRWMWKRRGVMTRDHKHQLLVEQKLLHFVDAFHQYVMDRVFHNAWIELCHNMASAGSLDEVIEVHDAYLLSVQRQCFVAPDKLWALIASRIKSILGLALDFYSVQQTLCTGGAAPAIKARCEMEVDRIEKQFDDCISFLLRILSFKLNVGQFPHLADLVTRINYNHYYMSDKGNLLTTPSFEASKLRKTYLNRND